MLKEMMMVAAMIMSDEKILDDVQEEIAKFKESYTIDPNSPETENRRKMLCTMMSMFLTKSIADTPEKMAKLSQRMDKHERLNEMFKDENDPSLGN